MVYDPDEILPELEEELLGEDYDEEYEEDFDDDEDMPDAVFQPDPNAGMGKKLLVVILDILVVWLIIRWVMG